MIHRNTTIALVAAGGYIAGAFALRMAENAGLIPHAASGRALQAFSGVALAIYAMIKISLVPAVIVAESTANPLTAIRRSWRLTKGNSLRLLLFYALLLIPYVIIAALVGGLFGAIGSLAAGDQGRLFVGDAAGAVIGALWVALAAAITAALYEQLESRPAPDLIKTFD